MRIAEGYWKTYGPYSAAFYHVTKHRDGLMLDYHSFTSVGAVSGTFITGRNDQWTVPVKSMTEKEYFLAVLKGGASR